MLFSENNIDFGVSQIGKQILAPVLRQQLELRDNFFYHESEDKLA
jgi:hypothetical protein